MTDPWSVLFVAVWVLLAVVLVVGALRPPAGHAARPTPPVPRPSGAGGRAAARAARPSTLSAAR